MKKLNLLMGLVGMASFASVAQASVSGMVGTWEGSGTAYTLEGDAQGSYGVELVDTLQSDGSVASAVTVSIPGQAALNFEYIFQDTPKGFSILSDEGSGGTVCLDTNLCEGYVGDDSGNGTALTLIIDGPTSFRSLKTELKGWKATSFSYEKYVRTQ